MKRTLGTIILASLACGALALAQSITGGALARSDLFRRFFTWDNSNNVTSVAAISTPTTFTSTNSSGNNAVAVSTNGARVDFGAGANDYCSSDGTTVTYAGPLAATAASGSTAFKIPFGSYISLDPSNNNSFIRAPVGSQIELSTNQVVPAANNTEDLGASTLYWANIYATNVIRQTDQATPVYAYPAAPGLNTDKLYDFRFDGGWPSGEFVTDETFALPMPQGFLRGGLFSPVSTTATWFQACAIPASWGATTTWNLIGDTANTPQQTVAGNNTVAWDAGTWRGRQRTIGMSSSAANNSSAAVRANIQQVNTIGGFVWWARTYFVITAANARFFAGLASVTAEISAAADPSAAVDSLYFGCDSGQTTLHVCTNIGSGTATCATDLGSNFPCTTSGAGYDFWFAVPPGATYANWYIERLDSAQVASGRITNIGPTGIQINSHVYLNTGSGGAAVRQDFGGWCYWTNF